MNTIHILIFTERNVVTRKKKMFLVCNMIMLIIGAINALRIFLSRLLIRHFILNTSNRTLLGVYHIVYNASVKLYCSARCSRIKKDFRRAWKTLHHVTQPRCTALSFCVAEFHLFAVLLGQG